MWLFKRFSCFDPSSKQQQQPFFLVRQNSLNVFLPWWRREFVLSRRFFTSQQQQQQQQQKQKEKQQQSISENKTTHVHETYTKRKIAISSISSDGGDSDSDSDSGRGEKREKLSLKYQLGEKTKEGFVVEAIIPLSHYECTAYQFRHERLGTRYIHLDTNDVNNVFAIALRTIPENDTGVSSILERMISYGTSSSNNNNNNNNNNNQNKHNLINKNILALNTYDINNTLISTDWTCYPFSTQSEQDFNNLLYIYLDRIFFPELNIWDFLQNGHRFEFENFQDSTSLLKIKGIIYNQRKQSLYNPSEIFAMEANRHIYSDNIYRHHFRGDPIAIRKLTYEQLKRFHQKYYHPSNTVLYSYGDLAPRLQIINELILSRFESIPIKDIDHSIILQPYYKEPLKYAYISGPFDSFVTDSQRQNRMCITWLCNPVEDVEETFGLIILSQLLLKNPDSPLTRALLSANLGSLYIPSSGFSLDTVQGSFTIDITRIREEDINKIEKLVHSSLQTIMANGFSKENIQTILHQIEIDQKKKNETFRLNLLRRMKSLVTHWNRLDAVGQSPIAALQIDKMLINLYNKVLSDNPTDPKYFENLIKKYLLNDKIHNKVCVVMKGDEKYVEKKNIREAQELESIALNLSEQNKEFLISQAKKLQQHQLDKSNIDSLSVLERNDIPVHSLEPHYFQTYEHTFQLKNELTEHIEHISCPLIHTNIITNDLVYFRILYDLSSLLHSPHVYKNWARSNEFHVLMPFYALCVANLGAANKSPEALAQAKNLKTGGIQASVHTFTPIEGNKIAKDMDKEKDNVKYLLSINSFCFSKDVDNMLELMKEMMIHPKYDFYNKMESLLENKVQMGIQLLLNKGENYAVKHAASAFSYLLPGLGIEEMLGGLSSIKFETQLLRAFQSQKLIVMKELIHLFEQMSKELFKRLGPINSLVVSDSSFYSKNKEKLADRFLNLFNPLEYFHLSNLLNENSQHLMWDGKEMWPNVWKVMQNSKIISTQHDTFVRPLRYYFAIPSETNFCAAALPTVSFTHEDSAALRVASTILNLHYLRQEICERGGASRSECLQNKNLFVMFSGQDPKCIETIDIFKHSIDWLLSDRITEKYIDEALFNIFGILDSPKSPQEIGFQELMQGIDEKARCEYRERLLAINKKTMREAVDKHLKYPFENDEVAYTILGKEERHTVNEERNKLEAQAFKVVRLM